MNDEEKFYLEDDEMVDNWEHITPKGVFYEVCEYEGAHHRRFNIRKYGGRKSFDVIYSHCIDEDELLIRLAIENEELKQKIKNIRKDLR